MAWEVEEEARVAALEVAVAELVAKVGALVTVVEGKSDFNDKTLYRQTYDALKPAEE